MVAAEEVSTYAHVATDFLGATPEANWTNDLVMCQMPPGSARRQGLHQGKAQVGTQPRRMGRPSDVWERTSPGKWSSTDLPGTSAMLQRAELSVAGTVYRRIVMRHSSAFKFSPVVTGEMRRLEMRNGHWTSCFGLSCRCQQFWTRFGPNHLYPVQIYVLFIVL